VFDQLGTQITQGDLFRVEAAASLLAAVLLLVSDRRWAWLPAGLVSVGALLAVVVTTYVALPALGPLPSIHDPAWSGDKVVVVLATGAAIAAWVTREVLRSRRG
jgi:hypothetical protein